MRKLPVQREVSHWVFRVVLRPFCLSVPSRVDLYSKQSSRYGGFQQAVF